MRTPVLFRHVGNGRDSLLGALRTVPTRVLRRNFVASVASARDPCAEQGL